jgi:hypothetical protein
VPGYIGGIKCRPKEPQVPPLRSYGAPVGMTILLCPQEFRREALIQQQNCHPRPELRRSAVEGPAVLSAGMTILLCPQEFRREALIQQQNCHPDRSSVGAQWRDLRFFRPG